MVHHRRTHTIYSVVNYLLSIIILWVVRVECRICKWKLLSVDWTFIASFAQLTSFRDVGSSFSFFLYILPGARFRALSAGVHCTIRVQDESLQVTISKLP